MTTEEKLEEEIACLVSGIRGDYLTYLGACESPIERLFAVKFFLRGELVPLVEPPHPSYAAWVWHHHTPNTQLVAQYEIVTGGKKYRVDFAMMRGSARVAIECDGHDFHEKTKEQAASDKARDRAMTLAGWTVLRFTGSEIYRDPMACLLEALQVARANCGATE